MNRQKHKLSRRILAMLLTAAMLVTMFPAAMFAAGETEPVEEPTVSGELVTGHSKSKTATELDENYQSKVTLSLPSDEEELVSDVLFVLDRSSCTQETAEEAGKLLSALQESISQSNASIKVGVVNFRDKAQVAYELQPISGSEDIEAIKAAIATEPEGSGTNVEAGLELAEQILTSDTEVEDSRKYVILATDGLTRLFNDENGVVKNIYNEVNPDNILRVWGNTTGWTFAKGFGENFKVPFDGNWDKYFSWVEEKVKADGDMYALDYATYGNELSAEILQESPNLPYIKLEAVDDHALNMDRAIYDAYYAYRDLEAQGYHCATVLSGSTELGRAFVDALNNGKTVDFDQIQKEIYYLLDAGSKVDDYMGYVEDDYNFDFVKDVSALSMNVGGQEYSAIKIEENVYGFAPDSSVDGGYKYILKYYPDVNEGEHFTWTTNVPVSNFAPVQLTYTVQLMNPKEEAGTYGRYDEDGSEKYEGLYTNNSATLTPKDSNEVEGEEEEFAKPTVSYTVAPKGEVLITPADITVYTGGDSYTGVIDDLENGTVDESPEGLPEPGYYLTLPDWINDKLNISSTDEGVSTGANDLSDNITFTYEGTDSSTGEDVTRSWPIELYYADEDGTSYEENISIGGTTRDRYIYQIEPSEPDGNTVRVQFQLLNDNGQIVPDSEPILSDNFQLDLNTLYQQYDMTIYAGYLDQQEVKAQIKDDDGALIATLPVKVDNGTLTVRGTTGGEEIVKVGDAENAAATVAANTQIIDEETESTITAVADNAVGYYINDSMVSVAPEDVHLLADELVVGDDAEEAKAILKDYMVENNIAAEGANFSYQYLDLVDNTNGNAWVTPTDDVDIYWKVPKTANNEDHDFKIVHFNGLNRQYDEPTASLIGTTGYGVEEYTVENSGLDIVEIGNEEYLKFSTDTFSPFILVWEEADDDDNPPYIPPTTGDDDDDEEEPDTPALDRVNHFLYVEGYPEDYRTGEYSDNEDLWPVKPQGNITRAEVATIFYRLLKDEVREEIETDVNSFPDVNEDDWFNITVSSLANMGAISGYEDGTFRPNEPITRAELASMAVRFYDAFEAEYEEGTFLDVDGDEWYADAIAAAEELGILGGYPDGTVRPNNNITRAETCAIVNRVLERRPHDDHLGDVEDMRTWPDNQPGAWYYADMQEATNGHYYEWIDIDGSKFEEWTEVDKDYDWTKR